MKNALQPSLDLQSIITSVKINELKKYQIKSLLLDVDGTLLPRRETIVHYTVVDWIDRAKSSFSVHLLSNNPSKRRIELIANQLNISYTHMASKPRTNKLVGVINKKRFNYNSTAIIGDRIFTDILVGNRLGLYTILLKPIGSDGSESTNKTMQNIERKIALLLQTILR